MYVCIQIIICNWLRAVVEVGYSLPLRSLCSVLIVVVVAAVIPSTGHDTHNICPYAKAGIV